MNTETPIRAEVIEFTQGSVKYDYFGGVIHPRLKKAIFDDRGFDIKITPVNRIRNFFISRGGYHEVIKLVKNGVHFASIGMRLKHIEGRRVSVKAIYIVPVGAAKMHIQSINKVRVEEEKRKVKEIVELVADPKKKIYIRPQSLRRIVQSMINEALNWSEIIQEHLK